LSNTAGKLGIPDRSGSPAAENSAFMGKVLQGHPDFSIDRTIPGNPLSWAKIASRVNQDQKPGRTDTLYSKQT
jgi:hypothetical protein